MFFGSGFSWLNAIEVHGAAQHIVLTDPGNPSVLLALLVRVVEGCGFIQPDDVFHRSAARVRARDRRAAPGNR